MIELIGNQNEKSYLLIGGIFNVGYHSLFKFKYNDV
jgi:hypothetical protein